MMEGTLTNSQRCVYDEIITGIKDAEKQKLYFICGCAGTGKSYLLKLIANTLYKEHGIDVILLAYTGIAAHNIGGKTIHSYFHIPVSDDENIILDYTNNYYKPQNNDGWVIIDEVSMVSNKLLRLVDVLLRKDRKSPELPFGGCNVLLFGDLMQLKPIFKNGNGYCFQKCFKDIYGQPDEDYNVWRIFEYRKLEQNVRQKSDTRYETFLNRLRVGEVLQDDLKLLETRKIPLVGQFDKHESVYLYPKNKDVNLHNEEMINTLKHNNVKIFTVYSEDRIVNTKKQPSKYAVPDEVNLTGGIPKRIELGIGARVMLKRNIQTEAGLCNGVIGTVTDFVWNKNHKIIEIICIKFDDENINNGKVVYLKPLPVRFDSCISGHPEIVRFGFPLILAWAITVHKSQGLTFTRVVLSIDTDFFERGQLYVALSRVRTLDSLGIVKIDKDVLLISPHDKHSLEELNRLNRLHGYPNEDSRESEESDNANSSEDTVYLSEEFFIHKRRKEENYDVCEEPSTTL